MSTVALQNLLETILGYNLSTANKRWLAEHLIAQVEAETKEQVEPYTIDEIDAMIDESEADFAAGRFYSMDEARQHRQAHMSQLLNS